ncbi:asparagine synthase-related protein [Streptomyces sp. CFMR 7]|uniref:asparagine synthase-related protein n=1 Tax=Streptomyces sp. CFMR 7 TaxID=1649184 RepID=UPI00119DAF41|nr:asparagine synthase-related protein [Streptomyces sp. CFMR 7]
MQSVREGPLSLSVVGDCRVNRAELWTTGLSAVRLGRWADLTRWAGSYWAVARHGDRLFVAGDLAGVRGLFAARTPQGVVWGSLASRVAAVIGSGPDLELLAARTVAGPDHWPSRSLYQGVQLIPGGRGLLLEGDRWTTVDVTALHGPTTLAGGAARVGHALREATEGCVSGHTQVGADLSGGLDSSTLALLAAERRPVKAVTYGGPLASREDTAFARRVAQTAAIEHHVCEGGPDTWHFSTRPPAATDEPTLSAAIAGLDAAYLAPVAGMGAHLTGHGGDVVLESSSAAFVDLVVQGEKKEAKAQVTAWARLRDQAPRLLWRQVQEAADLGRGGTVLRAADDLERARFSKAPSLWTWCGPGPAARWLTPHGRSVVAQLLRESAAAWPDPKPGEWDDWAALRLNGAAARQQITLIEPLGVHPVFPFLDNAVVRACLSIPAHERRRPGKYKPLLGLALPDLPRWLTGRRSKGSFGPVLLSGIRAHRPQLQQLIATSPLVQAGLVEGAEVAADLHRTAGGGAAAPWASLQQFLTASMWLNDLPAQRSVLGEAA